MLDCFGRARMGVLAAGAVLAGHSVAALAGPGDPAPVRVAVIEEAGFAERVTLSGTVTAERRAMLSPRTDGLVDTVAVDAGSEVRQGDLLLELDGALARLALRRAEQAAEEARARRDEARRLYDEARQLSSTGGIPETEAETRRSELRVREVALEQLETAASERAEILERHRLVAPFDGVVARRLTDLGEWVDLGDPVFELVGSGNMRFDVQAPQDLYFQLDADTDVRVKLDSSDDGFLPARIIAKVPLKDDATRTFLVRLAVDAPDGRLVAGSSGLAEFTLREREPSPAVPRDAVVRQPDGSRAVWVVDGGDGAPTASMRRVTLGGGLGGMVEVLDGLAVGERVVIRGNETLEDGGRVTILPPVRDGS